MFKLSGHSLTKADWFLPETMGLNITERSSTAQITRGFDSPDLQVGDWVLDDCEPGAGIVWRVKIADDNFSSLTRTCTLEHIMFIPPLPVRVMRRSLKSGKERSHQLPSVTKWFQ